MYKVYLLKSDKDVTKSYVGLTTKKMEDRLAEHNSGLSQYTRTYIPWKVAYYEIFYCRICAEQREKFLKSGVGYKIRKHLLLLENSSLKNGV